MIRSIVVLCLLSSTSYGADLALYPVEEHLITETNRQRALHGLPPYVMDVACQEHARNHSYRQARMQSMHHSGFRGGENVSMNSSSNSAACIGQWLRSPGHRAAFLSRRYTMFGVSAWRSRSGATYCTQTFR